MNSSKELLKLAEELEKSSKQWKKKIDFHNFFDQAQEKGESSEMLAKEIATFLKKELPEFPDIALFEESNSEDAIDDALESLYDWADDNSVWLGLSG